MISDESISYLGRMIRESHLDTINMDLTKNNISNKGMILLCQEIKEC